MPLAMGVIPGEQAGKQLIVTHWPAPVTTLHLSVALHGKKDLSRDEWLVS